MSEGPAGRRSSEQDGRDSGKRDSRKGKADNTIFRGTFCLVTRVGEQFKEVLVEASIQHVQPLRDFLRQR